MTICTRVMLHRNRVTEYHENRLRPEREQLAESRRHEEEERDDNLDNKCHDNTESLQGHDDQRTA